MRVYELAVDNFRGIRSLKWRPTEGLNCLIGPGDSTKTTILDALSLVLAGHWNVTFGDADFFGGDPENAIDIEVTLAQLPDELLSLDVFGFRLRGIGQDGTLVDEPEAGCEAAITLGLHVEADLEPVWSTRRASDEEVHRISAIRRRDLPAVRIGAEAQDHLRWTRSSAISRMTEGSDLSLRLADAYRAARAAVFANPDPALKQASVDLADFVRTDLLVDLVDAQPGLDPEQHFRSGSLTLHDGKLPASSLGLGSRRLVSLGAQRFANASDGILMIDEVESGLEPHRVRFILDRLRRAAESGKQVFITTHSPVAIQSLEADSLRVVRSDAGVTSVQEVPGQLSEDGGTWQAIARSGPQALLASRVVVCEGRTEMGVVAALVEHWDKDSDTPAALRGLSVMDGNGASQAPGRAEKLRDLGYEVALFVDHDDAVDEEDVASAVSAGCHLVQWSKGEDTELAASRHLPLAGLQDLLTAAAEASTKSDGIASIRDAVDARLGSSEESDTSLPHGIDVEGWIAAISDDPVRRAVGATASDRSWFKSETDGMVLGRVIAEHLADSNGSLVTTLTALKGFTHPVGA